MNLIKVHRFSNFFHKRKIGLLARFFEFIIFIIYNSRIPASVKIGKNTKFAYMGIGCVIHKDAIIGENCIIGQSITIGGRGPRKGVPRIGNNVYLGPGCRILGPVELGDNIIVGPNAVVINDIPSGSICAGIPANIIKNDISDITKYL